MKLKILHYMQVNMNLQIMLEPHHYCLKLPACRVSDCERFYNGLTRSIALYKNTSIYFEHFTLICVI